MEEVGTGKIPNGGTFGANVVSMAAGDKVLDLIEAGGFDNVDAHGKILRAGCGKSTSPVL